MRVLVIHNRYRAALPSGENVVVDAEVASLREAGVEVQAYLRSSDEIAALRPLARATVAARPLLSPRAMRDVERLISEFRPDVVHLHNLFPLISPMVIRVAARASLPIVQTVHNHRHVCVKATFFRDGQVCTDCLSKRIPWPAVLHGCYRDSQLQSIPMASALTAHRRTWSLVTRFLALTEELVPHLESIGIPREKIVVRPNTVPDPGYATGPDRSGCLFVGRLSEEKGIQLLVEAWRTLPVGAAGVLTIIGDGPLRDMASVLAQRGDVELLGSLDHPAVLDHMRRAATLVVPSTCPDVFPRVVVEAFASGLPVVATRLGGLPHIVTPDVGWLCEPESTSLAAAIIAATTSAASLAAEARLKYESVYSPQRVLTQLLDIYGEVIEATQQ